MDFDAWQREWDLVTAAPVPAIAALVVAATIGWFARLHIEGGQVAELKARLGTKDERLRLTQDALEHVLLERDASHNRVDEVDAEATSDASANDNREGVLRELRRPDRALRRRQHR
jgi:hypothetical protein